MLILTRKVAEEIVIGDVDNDRQNIVVKILDISGDQVKLGVQAPLSIPVNRREIYNIIRSDWAENKNY